MRGNFRRSARRIVEEYMKTGKVSRSLVSKAILEQDDTTMGDEEAPQVNQELVDRIQKVIDMLSSLECEDAQTLAQDFQDLLDAYQNGEVSDDEVEEVLADIEGDENSVCGGEEEQ
jgi:tetrahydromethanopterin S-methyltransferase subunit A